MIRKSTALILCLFLLVGLYGCAGQSHGDPLKSPMKFYYKTSDASYGDGQGATDYELQGNLWARVRLRMGIDGVSEGSNFSEAHRTLSALSLHCFSGAVRVSAAAADDPGAGEPVRRRSHRRLCLHYPDLPGFPG